MRVDRDRLIGPYWAFGHEDGYVASYVLQFLPGGQIGGYDSWNERLWQLEDGLLRLTTSEGAVTAEFDQVECRDGRLFLKARSRVQPWVTLCLDEQVRRPQHNETRTALASYIRAYAWSVGDHTYGIPSILEANMAKLDIGKYCSIGTDVHISLGAHRTDIASTYPFASLKRYWGNVPSTASDHVTHGDVNIGNDVWIGQGVFISSGVRIGDGAVIGAHSVVTKDVPAYAIVAGSPAKLLRNRFAPEIISELLSLRWWNLPDESVEQLVPFMLSENMDVFLRQLRELLDMRSVHEVSSPTHPRLFTSTST